MLCRRYVGMLYSNVLNGGDHSKDKNKGRNYFFKKKENLPCSILVSINKRKESTFWADLVLGKLPGTFLHQQLLNGTRP